MIVEIDKKRALEIIDKVANFMVERRMSSAAIMMIESLRPINFIGSQMMYLISPFAEVFINPKDYQEFAALIENEEYVKLLSRRIDDLEEDYLAERRRQNASLNKRKKKKLKNFLKKILRLNNMDNKE